MVKSNKNQEGFSIEKKLKETRSKKNLIEQTQDKSKSAEKALFIQRLAAFLLDIFIVSMIASLLSYPFLDLESIDKLNESSTQVVEDYMSQKIGIGEYTDESLSISYEMARKQGIHSLVTIFLNILYFVVFQVKNDGQTIGKRLLRIKVSSQDGKSLGMNQMIFRSLIINSIFIDMVSFGILLFTNETIYFYGAGILGMIQLTIIAVSGFMIMFGQKRQGIHDLIAHTDVVKCNLVKEMEICEN